MIYSIEVENLTKRFGEITAVDHVSFSVRRGEIFGFLGPNGAGKTTTIRVLTGVLKPDEGRARVAGYDILENSIKARQCIGVVPEVSNAYIDLSAWDNLMLIGMLYGVPKRERTESAKKLMKDFNIYDVRHRLVRGLSKGMRQKLLLCMALINDPEILFLDEPTSGLDVESARLLREKIRQYNREGKTKTTTQKKIKNKEQIHAADVGGLRPRTKKKTTTFNLSLSLPTLLTNTLPTRNLLSSMLPSCFYVWAYSVYGSNIQERNWVLE